MFSCDPAVKVKSVFVPVTADLSSKITSVIHYHTTTTKLLLYQTKVEVISIMDSILAILWSHGLQESCNGRILEKIDFISEILKIENDIWLQQTSDLSTLLKDLLLTVSLIVLAQEWNQSSLSKFFSRMNPFRISASQQLDAINYQVSISFHLLKDSWRKCVECKKMTFCSKRPPKKCISCGSPFIPRPMRLQIN